MKDVPFVISREFDAPRDVVWKSWTEAARLKQWWGPKDFVVHTCKVDLQPGGLFLYGMTAPDGSDMWGRFLFLEIDAPKKLVFITSFSDPEGGISRHPWHMDWPLQMLSSVTFESLGSRTMVTVQSEPHEAAADEARTFYDNRDSLKQGWTGTLDKLDSFLVKR